MKAFSEQGEFWLSDNPSDRVPGVLDYDPSTGITLDLMGEFEQPLEQVRTVAQILGILKTSKSALLENCSISSGGWDQGTGFTYSYTSYVVRDIYLNVHFNEDMSLSGELSFDKIVVEFPLLLQWVGAFGLRRSRDQGNSAVSLWFEMLNEIKGSMGTGDEAGFSFRFSLPGNDPFTLSEIKVTQTTYFFYTSQNACNLYHLLRHSTAIARLLSFVFAKKISPSCVEMRQAGEWQRDRWIEVFFCPDEYAEEIEGRKEINGAYRQFNALGHMSYDALGGMNFVTKWLDIADKNYVVLSKLMSCKFGSMPHKEDRFHQARSAIEAYWVLSRRSGTDKRFVPADRLLVDLVNEAGFSNVLGEDPSSWASSVEANRNGYSSHFQRITQPVDATEMIQQTNCLYYLTLVLLLKDAGVEDSVLDGIRRYVKRLHAIRTSQNP